MRATDTGAALIWCLRRGAAAPVHGFPRYEGRLIPVIGTPFDARSIQWAEARLPAAGVWHLAEPADIVAYLSGYEETQRALDGVLSQGRSRCAGSNAEVIFARQHC